LSNKKRVVVVVDDVITVVPSRLRQFVYCPRQVFFDYYLAFKKPLKQRLRMFLGRVLHLFFRLFKRGYRCEELLEVDVPELGVKLVGKPDAYKINPPEVVEYKTSKMPTKPWYGSDGIMAYLSDVVQACAYAYIIKRKFNIDNPITITIHYLDGVAQFNYNENMEEHFLDELKQYKQMVENKLLPEASIGRKCRKCPYLEICKQIEENLPF